MLQKKVQNLLMLFCLKNIKKILITNIYAQKIILYFHYTIALLLYVLYKNLEIFFKQHVAQNMMF